MTNLVKNGVEAAREARSGDRGRVHIEADPWTEGVEIRVGDSGAGVDESDRARLFDPYFTTKEAGTGLGLAIVQRIVQEHRGSIRIGVSTMGGAEVVIRLTVDGPPASAAASHSTLSQPGLTKRS